MTGERCRNQGERSIAFAQILTTQPLLAHKWGTRILLEPVILLPSSSSLFNPHRALMNEHFFDIFKTLIWLHNTFTVPSVLFSLQSAKIHTVLCYLDRFYSSKFIILLALSLNQTNDQWSNVIFDSAPSIQTVHPSFVFFFRNEIKAKNQNEMENTHTLDQVDNDS